MAPYSTFGTEQLAKDVTAALQGRSGALMSNHGAITVGPNLDKALDMLPYLEYVCEIQLRALATGLPIKTLSDDEMAQARAGMSGYTKKSAADSK